MVAENSIVVIMAGGLGKRMNSDLPKVLHLIQGEPMLVRILKEAYTIEPYRIYIVVGKYKSLIENTIRQYIDWDSYRISLVEQPEALGTGHAIQCCVPELMNHLEKKVLILSGDVPLLTAKTMKTMMVDLKKVRIMTTHIQDPTGYGRIICPNGFFVKIKEEKDCLPEEKKIKKINCGIYAFDIDILCRYLPKLTNKNSSKEYYLTDIIEWIKIGELINIDMFDIPEENQFEIMGVNTKEQLEALETRIEK